MRHLIQIFIIVLIALLSACGTIDKISDKAGAEEVLFLNKNGDLVIIDKGKAKIIPSCDDTDRKGFEDCKIPFDLDNLKENPDELKSELEKSCKSKNCGPGFVKNVKSLLIIDHPGSTCRLIYDRATGRTFQICR